MNTLDDLYTLVRLLKEFELPISPILQYSIDIKKEQLECETSSTKHHTIDIADKIQIKEQNTKTVDDSIAVSDLSRKTIKTSMRRTSNGTKKQNIKIKNILDHEYRFSYKIMQFSVMNLNDSKRLINAPSESRLYKTLSPTRYLDQVEEILVSPNHLNNKIKVNGHWYDYYGNKVITHSQPSIKTTSQCSINNHKIGAFGSWIVVSDTILYKACDPQLLNYSRAHIHKKIKWFWDAEDLVFPQKKDLFVQFKDTICAIQIMATDKNNPSEIEICFNDFFADISKQYKITKTTYLILKKTKSKIYNISFL